MKKIFALSPITLLLAATLSGCGEPAVTPSKDDATISLFDSTSRIVVQDHSDKGSIGLATYRSSKTGSVPYVNVGEFFADHGAFNGHVKVVVSHTGSTYTVKGDDRLFLTIDAAKDTMTIDNYEYWSSYSIRNNGVGPDLGNPAIGDETEKALAVHPSNKSKYIGQRKSESYDLKKYSFDAIAKGDDVYLPFQLLSNIFYRFQGNDLVYNGYDYYVSSAINNEAAPWLHFSFYANNRKFYTLDNELASFYTPKGNEAYRIAYLAQRQPAVYRIMSLTKDGKGTSLLADSPEAEGKQETADPAGTLEMCYTWKKEGGALFATMVLHGPNGAGQIVDEPRWTQKIPLVDGILGLGTRPKEIVDFTYNILRFQFDHYYGLKDVAKYDDFDAFVTKKGLKERLLSSDPDTYDEALCELLMSNIDDCHTVYNYPSLYSGKFSGKELASKYLGPRYRALILKNREISALRAQAHGVPTNVGANLVGLYKKNKTAVIRFDTFAAQGTWISNSKEELDDVDIRACFLQGNVPLGFDASFHQIKKDSNIKNVVIDLTCNGGGEIMVVPYILAHFSSDPHMYFRDCAMDILKEYHYSVDLNHDGVYGGEGDTYQGKYNFYILTSGFSFSCANFTPTAAKDLGVKIVGEVSGGGACSVGTYSDGSGSIYDLSSPISIVTPFEGSYVHTDAGVPVDKAIPSDSWYDLAKLEAAIAGV